MTATQVVVPMVGEVADVAGLAGVVDEVVVVQTLAVQGSTAASPSTWLGGVRLTRQLGGSSRPQPARCRQVIARCMSRCHA